MNIPVTKTTNLIQVLTHIYKDEFKNFKPIKNSMKNSIRTADLHSWWSITDKEMNPSTKGYFSTKDSNFQKLQKTII
jgi:hypothetical protein